MMGRIAVAALFLSLLIASILLPGMRWMIVAFIAATAVACVQEVRHMFRGQGVGIRKRVALGGVAALVLEGAFFHLEFSVLILGAIASMAFALRLRGADVGGAFRDVAATIGVVVYIGLPSAIWAALFMHPADLAVRWIVLALVVVFLTDSTALFVGKALGRHKLIPRVSPGKTIEGSIGGYAGALVGVIVAKMVFQKHWMDVTWFEVIAFALFFCTTTQVGDLVESMVKRDAGVKDSGPSLGGHGGFLDMLDAVLYTAIPLAIYLRIFHPEAMRFEAVAG
ncbi:MAG: phosphatidate cytidylyltransferase [Candidatus Sumerlaeia bacterium]|nr:phosphatidate cytidylyltransferase [Candidatus Sumerlaeia bacterium]